MDLAKFREKTESTIRTCFISLSIIVGDDFQPLFQKAWAAPRGERERARKSGIGEDLVLDDHQWMIGIIK